MRIQDRKYSVGKAAPRSGDVSVEPAASAKQMGASVHCPTSHTLFDPEHLMAKCMMDAPKSYGQFLKLVAKCGKPPAPLDAPSSLPAVPEDVLSRRYRSVPTLEDLGYERPEEIDRTPFPGGESEGLRRLEDQFQEIRSRWAHTAFYLLLAPGNLDEGVRR